MQRENKSIFLLGIYIIFFIITFSACIDEPFVVNTEGTFISVAFNSSATGNGTRAYEGTKDGEYPDNVVRTLRILAFNTDGAKTVNSNTSYDIINSALDVVRHPMMPGTYDVVFIANEPESSKSSLDGITQLNSLYSITFPKENFAANELIPMLQVIESMQITSEGKVILQKGTFDIHGNPGNYPANPNNEITLLQLELDRLAARVEIELKSKLDLTGLFTGITLSNIPDRVPLFASKYSGDIIREIRSLTLAADAQHFEDITPEGEGIVWAKKIKRIILPSSNQDLNTFTDTTDDTKAIVLTANVEDKYNPSAKLQIESTPNDNYSLPYNSWLDVIGIVNEPLELNISASPWEPVDEDWQMEIRMLNVSQTEVNITDFNGARISFWSNMPSVRVLPEVYLANGTKDVTNLVFNDLAMTDVNRNQPSRFYYDPNTGAGYMDILVDSLNTVNGTWQYKLYLVAENTDGTNQLRREITVKINQYGTRYAFNHYSLTGYVGAFFRNEETGERIITGQAISGLIYSNEWTAIADDDWIILSSTPSFDPDAGTDNPGNPENYVITGTTSVVRGRGRIYFRVGVTGNNTTGTNRYGTISLTYNQGTWSPTIKLYVRQGEADDYVYSGDDGDAEITINNATISYSRSAAARKFSPYNLTAQGFKDNPTTVTGHFTIPQRTWTGNPATETGGGVFVDYPTQAGAFFQWEGTPDPALDTDRWAYHPSMNGVGFVSFADVDYWDTDQDEDETCPPGYSRPNDGSETGPVYAGLYYNQSSQIYEIIDRDKLANSTFRMSLFEKPEAGNGYEDANVEPTYPGSEYYLEDKEYPSGASSGMDSQTSGGFYADGFFDRRPLDNAIKGVSNGRTDVAYSGLLFFNRTTKASLFFPAAGRLNDNNGTMERVGETGSYWSSSVGASFALDPNPGWCFAFNYYYISAVSQTRAFACSIRCVAGYSVSSDYYTP